MSVRVRIAITIIAIGSFVVIVGIGGGMQFTNRELLRSIQNDMDVVADTVDRLITSEINLLKVRAFETGWYLLRASNNFHRELEDNLNKYGGFLALTVLDRTGVVDSAGSPTFPTELLNSVYIEKAFAGEPVISTSYLYPGSPAIRVDASDAGENVPPGGKLVFFVCVPMENFVLVATVDGFFFCDVLKNLDIWETGHIFIDDGDGYVLANPRENWVRERWNIIEKAKKESKYEGAAKVVSEMVRGNSGMGIFTLNDQERFCTYRPITGSKMGWSLGVVAPVNESPLASARDGLLMVGFICILLCIIAAIPVSVILAKPYDDTKAMMGEMKRQDELLVQANKEALVSSKAKSVFLANMSHEMRTPLNAIIGLSELTLSSGELQGCAAENVEKVYGAGMTLLGIVNDILDLSKIESGKFEIVPAEYDIPSLINDTVTLNIMRIGDKPIRFHLYVDGTLPNNLIGDALRIKQIFNNLLSNAFKYTREGNVDWTISCERETPTEGSPLEGDSLWLVSSVKDSGIGIRKEDLDHLFSDYSQLDTKSNREIEGTGLGLSITKKMVEMMGGSIMVESEYGKGSVFTVCLRQQFANDATIGDDVARNLMTLHYVDNKCIKNNKLIRIQIPYARVLVVDDVVTNLDVARGLMKPYGMTVDCVNSGLRAIELIRSEKPHYDTIFMDHMMPGMDGIEAVRIIREEIGTDYARNIPIIALTANAILGNEEMFLAHGFQAFLSKPIDIMAMDVVIRQWVRNKDLEHAKEQKAGEMEISLYSGERLELPDRGYDPDRHQTDRRAILETAIPGIDSKKGVNHFGEDWDIYWNVVKSFAQNTPPLLNTIRTLPVEFPAVELNDYAIIVHGIKSSSRNIGAEDLGLQAEALEHAAKAGDLDFIRKNHGVFMQAANQLLEKINTEIRRVDKENQKPLKTEPAKETLEDLLHACRNFDIDGVDRAMEELESCEYKTGADLVAWLREKADGMGFKEIAVRLS
jgi:signal transduction histidine kinase/DNA-binding response OmpR family regulator/HPt (histidine-containing phosphotransfer) domain-containing protein